ncbi:MAG: M20 family metallo-hydrolase [Bacteroidales bacterium]|jgi:acetylornithine deacetylase|nr:M20 family metallo-hydrolase [Bacteroidales bacterium]
MYSDELYYNAVDLLKAIIAVPSFSKEENSVAELIRSYIEQQGLTAFRSGNNTWCQSLEVTQDKPTILLNSHIDTVKPVAGWKREPFRAEENGGKLYGLGSNDAGASLVALLQAFMALTQKKQPYNLIFLASAEEEISGENGIESLLSILPTVTFAIAGEPTNMHPAIAEKGLMVLDCTAHGLAGHAARTEGVNAIYKAITDIEWFREYHFSKISEMLGNVKMTVTQINAGTQHNVVPNCCSFVVDVRTTDCYTNREVFDIVAQHVECEVSARSFRLNSSSISPEHPFVERTLRLGKKPFGSPTLSDQALMPFPSVKIGPGDSARSHSADEYILLDEIREGIELYIKLLDGLIV